MRKIITAYRTATSGRDMAQQVAEFLKNNLNCASISIFELNEISRHLTLLYTTSRKFKKVNEYFEKGSLVYDVFDKNQDVSVGNIILRSSPKHTDVFFEDVKIVFSMAFARIFDCYDKPVGIIRALNKQSSEGVLIDFSNNDLANLIEGANILGSGLVALTAHLRATAFLDSVTHELLAPMSGAKGAANFLIGYHSHMTEETENERKDRIMSNLGDIVRCADASISLVQGITMFSRSGLMSEHDLDKKPTRIFKDVISKSISNVSPLIASRRFDRNKIRPVDHHSWPLLKIDQKIIEQVFSNLLSNSIKYAFDDPESFSVDIIMEKYPNGDVKIVIKDYGIGIDSKDATKIFHPGERGDRAKAKVPTGMGIGLTTVQKLIKIHGMSIELSNLSMPTEFTIRIPKQFVIGGR